MSAAMDDARLIAAAREGDEAAFGRLVEPYRGALYAHCYRMLGSLQDAEDALQDAMLRAWRGLGGFDASRPLRPWLYRIATNACLDVISRRPRRVLPADRGPASSPADGPGEPVIEGVWVEPFPDEVLGLGEDHAGPDARYEQRESVELAFIAAVQHLPARQRAVLLLREVLGFSAGEVAQSLETSAASVNSALQRARRTIEERLPARSQQATLRQLGDDGVRDVVRRYVEAWETRNVDAMVAVLVEDATFAMPPLPGWFRGRDAVVAFIAGTGTPDLRHVIVRAGGQPAVAWYLPDRGGDGHVIASLEVLGLEGDRVRDITAFLMPDVIARFGVPARLES